MSASDREHSGSSNTASFWRRVHVSTSARILIILTPPKVIQVSDSHGNEKQGENIKANNDGVKEGGPSSIIWDF